MKKIIQIVALFGSLATISFAYGMEKFSVEKLEETIREDREEEVKHILANLIGYPVASKKVVKDVGELLMARLGMTPITESKTVLAGSGQAEPVITIVGLDRERILTTALMAAIRADSFSMVKMLVDEFEADVNSKKAAHGNLSKTALALAEELHTRAGSKGWEPIIIFLERRGAHR